MVRKIVFAMLTAMLMLTACGGNDKETISDQNATPATVPAEYAGLTNPLGAEAAAEGAEVFRTNCEMCHGPQGHGDGPAGQSLNPKPKDLAELQTRAGDDFLYWRIHEGVPGTSMVAWKAILTEEQIWQAVAFIRTLK